jgi:hypothetical protein
MLTNIPARTAIEARLDKQRKCVVLRDDGERKEIIYGQSVPGHGAVEVKLGTPEGRALNVSKDTYFRDTNVRIIEATQIVKVLGRCPAGLFTKLEKLRAGVTDAIKASGPAPRALAATPTAAASAPIEPVTLEMAPDK